VDRARRREVRIALEISKVDEDRKNQTMILASSGDNKQIVQLDN
jgi:hypothetical protein